MEEGESLFIHYQLLLYNLSHEAIAFWPPIFFLRLCSWLSLSFSPPQVEWQSLVSPPAAPTSPDDVVCAVLTTKRVLLLRGEGAGGRGGSAGLRCVAPRRPRATCQQQLGRPGE